MPYKEQSTCHDKTKKTILVVEDDDSIGMFLVQALSEETPYEAVLVSDSRQVLNLLTTLKPSLFITDYKMPYMDGIELYDRIRSEKELASTPAIIMSAQLPEQEIKKRNLISLNKPFELDELLNTVQQLLAS